MLRHPGKTALLVAVTIILSYSFGCILSPEEEIRPDPKPPAEFKDLTTPENLIHNLVLSYQDLNIIEYTKLLLKTDDGSYGKGYYWYFQEADVIAGEEYLDGETDITRTGNLFLAAKATPAKPEHPIIDRYGLEIAAGTWQAVDSLWGEPCEDCWYTSRGYYVYIEYGGDRIYGDDQIKFYVVPVQEGDVTTYRIATAFDVLY
jgi:hypothetical protein